MARNRLTNYLPATVVMVLIALLPPTVMSTAAAQESPPSEWTFEQADRQWDPMTRAVQHVGVPGCQWQVGVYWDGSLIVGQTLLRGYGHPRLADEVNLAKLGNYMLHLSVGYGSRMRFVDRRGSNSQAIRKGLEEGRLPIPFVETQDGDLVWQEKVFAHLLGRAMEDGLNPRPDDALFVQVRFVVRNMGRARQTGHLWFHFGDTSQTKSISHQLGELGQELSHTFDAPFGRLDGRVRYVIPPVGKGVLRWHDQVAAPQGMTRAAKRVIEWDVPLASGEEAELRLILPYGLVDEKVAGLALGLDYETELAKVRAFWRRLAYGPGQITTPDLFINDYLVAVAGQMAEQVAYRQVAKLWMYKTSPNQYEDYYPANAAKALPTFDLRGLTSINRRVLQSFIDFQSDDASGMMIERASGERKLGGEGFARTKGFLGNYGIPVTNTSMGFPTQGWTANMAPMCHGAELWALACHYRMTRDDEWLGRGPGSRLQAMIDGFDWVTVQRKRTMREENGRKVRHWGLLPAAAAHDWLSGNTIFNDAWCIYGMIEVVHVLREIGHPRAEEMARELNDYRACLRQRYIEARDRARRLPLPDGTEMPFVPRMVTEPDWSRVDDTFSGYGPLRAGGLGALDPFDELMDQALAFLEAGRPAADNPARREHFWRHYVLPETMWPIYEVFLNRDDLPRFFEMMFNDLAGAVHRDFRVGCESRDEVVSVAPGDAERWRMIRDMFVHERGGWDGGEPELFLLQAMPRSWLRPGYHLSVSRMGTSFGGSIDLDIRVTENGDSVVVSAKLEGLKVKPQQIRMRLRSGDGRKLAGATINGSEVNVLKGDVILLPVRTDASFKVVGKFTKNS